MYFATFFRPSATDPTRLVEACGDRAVIILDGRCQSEHHPVAAKTCQERRYAAYQIHKGDSLLRTSHSSEVISPAFEQSPDA